MVVYHVPFTAVEKQNYRGMDSTTEIQSRSVYSQLQAAVTLAESMGISGVVTPKWCRQ